MFFQRFFKRFVKKPYEFVQNLDLEWYFNDGPYVPDDAVVNENEKKRRGIKPKKDLVE